MDITRSNIDTLLDTGRIEAAMSRGRWWKIRRNGKTKKWVTDENRIRIPVKAGLRATYAITEFDFNDEGVLDKNRFRVATVGGGR